jgi:hypothetical protein
MLFQTLFYVLMINVAFLLQNLHKLRSVEYLCANLFPFENTKKKQQQEIHGPWTDVPA